jgi:CheY-like chemotaxis protein
MRQRTVLVVEDDAAIRSLLSLVLETRDYQVTSAADGQQALLRIHAERPDVVLLDLMLPHVNGWSVIEALERDARLNQIPVIVMSAYHDAAQLKGRGVRAFLSKPFDIDGLFRALEDVFEATTSTTSEGAVTSLNRSTLPSSPRLTDPVLGPRFVWGPHPI